MNLPQAKRRTQPAFYTHAPPYAGAKGALGRALTLPEIFKIAGVPEKRWVKLEKVYNEEAGRYKKTLCRIYGIKSERELIEELKGKTDGAISDFRNIQPSMLPEFFPHSYGLIRNPNIEIPKGTPPHLVRTELRKGWKTMRPHRRSVFRRDHKTTEIIKGSGGMSVGKGKFRPELPFQLLEGRVYGGAQVDDLAHDFAVSLEIIKALKKQGVWHKFKNKIRMPLNITALEEVPLGGGTVKAADYVGRLLQDDVNRGMREGNDFEYARNSIVLDKLKRGGGLGQIQYAAKSPYERLGKRGAVFTISKENFMRAQGFKSSDAKIESKRQAAVGNFVKDLAEYLSVIHSEGIALTDLENKAVAAKDIGPRAESNDFDIATVRKWGIKNPLYMNALIENDYDHALGLIMEFSQHMQVKVNPPQDLFKETYFKNKKLKWSP